MAKSWYEELFCDDCNKHVGYRVYSGPTGSVICDDCYEKEPDTVEEVEEK